MFSFMRSDRFMHCGGEPKRGSDFCAHHIESWFSFNKIGRHACFVLFLDVIRAFDSFVKFIVFNDVFSIEDIWSILVFFGFIGSFFLNIVDISKNDSVIECVGVSKHFESAVTNFHRANWFTFQSIETYMKTMLGWKVGCPFGDMILFFL